MENFFSGTEILYVIAAIAGSWGLVRATLNGTVGRVERIEKLIELQSKILGDVRVEVAELRGEHHGRHNNRIRFNNNNSRAISDVRAEVAELRGEQHGSK